MISTITGDGAASDEVSFLGAVYEPDDVAALRFHSVVYLHGHTVGGTNPSLVEAMAAGNAVVAHDNEYNRWVARDGARYFSTRRGRQASARCSAPAALHAMDGRGSGSGTPVNSPGSMSRDSTSSCSSRYA